MTARETARYVAITGPETGTVVPAWVLKKGELLVGHLTGGSEFEGLSKGLPFQRGSGHCRICGVYGPLTFEHIPPRAAGNSTRRRFADVLHWAQRDTVVDFPRSGWTPQQRGEGAYLLCAGCNHLLSHRGYVGAYVHVAAAVMSRLHDRGCERPSDRTFFGPVDVQMSGIDTGRVARQVMAMMLCLSGSPALGRTYPQLRDLVLKGTPCPLPEDFRLEWGMTFGTRCRVMPPVATTMHDGSTWAQIELAFPPFVWMLRYGSGWAADTLGDVGSWTTHSTGTTAEVRVRTSIVPTVSPFPGDYRTAEELTGG